jgi:hypothetical protein
MRVPLENWLSMIVSCDIELMPRVNWGFKFLVANQDLQENEKTRGFLKIFRFTEVQSTRRGWRLERRSDLNFKM